MHADETHLNTDIEWHKLSTHLQHAAAPLTRCCFQCGMLNYATPGDKICVTNVTRKADCRAYRVFRYYIRKLVSGEQDRLRSSCVHATERELRSEAYRNVFLCKLGASESISK